MKKKKPRELKMVSYGTEFRIKVDSRMSNLWIQDALPMEIGKAKQLHKWLEKYLKWAESR